MTPSGKMECGVTPSGRRISLKGAVAHFFLSFILPFSFLTQQLVCPLSRIEASCHNPFSLVLFRPPPCAALVLVLTRPPPRAALVLSDPVLGRHRAPYLSCPKLSSAAAARRSCPVRSCPRPLPRANLVLVPLPKALLAWLLQYRVAEEFKTQLGNKSFEGVAVAVVYGGVGDLVTPAVSAPVKNLRIPRELP